MGLCMTGRTPDMLDRKRRNQRYAKAPIRSSIQVFQLQTRRWFSMKNADITCISSADMRPGRPYTRVRSLPRDTQAQEHPLCLRVARGVVSVHLGGSDTNPIFIFLHCICTLTDS